MIESKNALQPVNLSVRELCARTNQPHELLISRPTKTISIISYGTWKSIVKR